MTCIVAVEENGRVVIGGDRMGSNSHTGSSVSHSKVFNVGEITIGYTSSFRMGQLLQYALEVPEIEDGTDIDKWVSINLMQAIRKAYKDNGWDKEKDGEATNGSFLLVAKNRVYEIQTDYSYIRNISGEYAIGSGADYALGSLRSTRGKMPIEARVIESLESAAEYVLSVAAPFDILTVEEVK